MSDPRPRVTYKPTLPLLMRYLLLVLPTCAAFGSFFPGIGQLFAFRALVLSFVVIVVVYRRRPLVEGMIFSRFRVMGFAWLTIGTIGWCFIPDASSAVTDMASIFVGLSLAYALVADNGNLDSKLRHIQAGWIIAFLITSFLALREAITGTHMSNYFPSTDIIAVDTRLLASAFGNPNAYAVFLVTSIPFLMKGILGAHRWITRLGYTVAIFIALFLLLGTGSRLCIAGALLELLIFGAMSDWRRRRSIIAGGVALFLGVLTGGPVVLEWVTRRLPDKLATANVADLVNELSTGGVGSSGGRRLDVYRDGLWMIWRSAGLGVGPGNFRNVMRNEAVPFDTAGVVDPHNLYLEVASQYGVIVFILFFAWIAVCWRRTFMAGRSMTGDGRAWGIAMTVAVSGNAVAALANSSYLPGSTNWMFIATLLVVSVSLEQRSRAFEAEAQVKTPLQPKFPIHPNR